MIAHAAEAAMTGLQDCILVVDDEILIAELWCMILEDMQLEVCGIAKTADAAITLAQQFRPKVVLMDVRLEGRRDGIDAAIAIRETVGSKVIFITGSRDSPTIARIQPQTRHACCSSRSAKGSFRTPSPPR
nr:response regulator [uncultured Rhodopila sp.]